MKTILIMLAIIVCAAVSGSAAGSILLKAIC